MLMERRSFLLALVGAGLAGRVAEARLAPVADFRTQDLVGGEFAMRSSRLALSKTRNPDIVNFAHAEIAEQVQVATALGALPGTAPLPTTIRSRGIVRALRGIAIRYSVRRDVRERPDHRPPGIAGTE